MRIPEIIAHVTVGLIATAMLGGTVCMLRRDTQRQHQVQILEAHNQALAVRLGELKLRVLRLEAKHGG